MTIDPASAVFQTWIGITAILYTVWILISWFLVDRSLGGVIVGILIAAATQYLLYDIILGIIGTVV